MLQLETGGEPADRFCCTNYMCTGAYYIYTTSALLFILQQRIFAAFSRQK